MIKIEELRPLYVVHSLATAILAGTIALLGYEVSKPKIIHVEASSAVFKASALMSAGPKTVITYRLPALSERFQRKVLVHSVRKKAAARGQTDKSYMALNRP